MAGAVAEAVVTIRVTSDSLQVRRGGPRESVSQVDVMNSLSQNDEAKSDHSADHYLYTRRSELSFVRSTRFENSPPFS
jgi:hypothetical protein